MSIRVLLVDDHEIVRQGLRTLLSGCDLFEIVGEACNGKDGCLLATSLKPDVILMDIAMPEMGGIEAAQKVKAELPNTKIVALSVRVDGPTLDRMLMAGASGFLSKDCARDELVHALKSVVNGNSYLSPEVARLLMTEYVEVSKNKERPATFGLTPGELRVLKLVAEGKSTKEIATDLGISGRTVDARRRSLMDKTGCESLADLVKLAIRSGLTDVGS